MSLFPSGIASGEAFCNRESERAQLTHNIQHVRHTLIISPRRYGKTSLALAAIKETECAYATINFFNALRDEDVIAKFMEGISKLTAQVLPPTQNALAVLAELFKSVQVSLGLLGMKFNFELRPISQDPIQLIRGLLQDMESLLRLKNKKATVFLDEFQDIIKTEKSDLLQAELRDFAQQTQHVSFIISGSHRHMLNKIFDDRNKPFYKLCDRINLQRIKSSDYQKFLEAHSQIKWNEALNEIVTNSILKLTENHSYYLNKLCARLWMLEKTPSVEDVVNAWQILSQEEYDSIVNEASLLSRNQRLILQTIAKLGFVKAPNSIDFMQQTNMAHSSITQAMSFLLKNDFIENTEVGYCLVDPIMKYLLNQISPERFDSIF